MPKILDAKIDFFEDIRNEIGKHSYMGSIAAVIFDAEDGELTKLCIRLSLKLDLSKDEPSPPKVEIKFPNGRADKLDVPWPPPVRDIGIPEGFPHWISANLITGSFKMKNDSHVLVRLKMGRRWTPIGSLHLLEKNKKTG